MKKIQCEVCGSSEIKKTGENQFQCAYCGVQYSKEDVQKLFIEISGTVEVKGIAQIENIITNADYAFEDKDYSKADALYSDALNLDPTNTHVQLYRALSSAWQSSVKDCRTVAAYKACERAITQQHNVYGDTKDYFTFVADALYQINLLFNGIKGMFIQYSNNAQVVTLSITANIMAAPMNEQVLDTANGGLTQLAFCADALATFCLESSSQLVEANQAFFIAVANLYAASRDYLRSRSTGSSIDIDTIGRKQNETLSRISLPSTMPEAQRLISGLIAEIKVKTQYDFWREHGLCGYCGGRINAFGKCKNCGKKKI